MEKEKVNILLWLRVSSGKQDFNRQLNQLLNRIDNINGENKKNKINQKWEEVGRFSEKKSGYRTVKRDEFEDFKEHLEKNKDKIDKVMVTEISRIARSGNKIEEFIFFCKNLNISVYIDAKPNPIETIEKDLSTLENLPNKLLLTMLTQFAQLEAELIGERSVGGKIKKFEDGEPLHFGKIPYSFDLKNKQLVVNSEEAENVKTIFDLAEKHGARYISAYLNANGILYRDGKEWNPSSIKNMLNNEIYTGKQVFNFEVNKLKNKGEKKKEYEHYTNYLDVIISEEQFKRVQANKKSRKNRQGEEQKHTDKYLFLNKLYCECGSRYKSTLYENKQGVLKDAHYMCLAKKSKCGCTSSNIPNHIFDSAFWKAFSFSTRLFKKIIQETEDDFDLQGKKNLINMHEAKIEEHEANIENTEHVFRHRGKKADWDEFDKEVDELKLNIRGEEKKIRELNRLIRQFEKREQLTEGDYIKKIVEEKSLVNRRVIVEKYVDRVVIHTCNKELSQFTAKTKMFKNESLFYIRIYVLGSSNPIDFVCTNKNDNFKIVFKELDKFEFKQQNGKNILIEKY